MGFAIPHLAVVIDGFVYRGGQPFANQFEPLIETFRLRTIIKLNFDDEGSDRTASIPVLQFSMPPRDLAQSVGAPDDVDVAQALAALSDEGNWPVYVHCTHGQDRTGLLIGEFRVIKQNWKITRAWDEMLDHGFHWELIDLSRSWMSFLETHLG